MAIPATIRSDASPAPSPFQKTAVALSGDGLTVDLDDVTTTGEGGTDVTAQNGIQVGYGAVGTLDNCQINDVAYTGESWTATGLMILNTSGLDRHKCPLGVRLPLISGKYSGCFSNKLRGTRYSK